jgi:hypothetical protein
MWPGFWKASLISLAGYTAAAMLLIWTGFWLVLLIVPALQAAWALFCIGRIVQLRRCGGHRADAPEFERNDYGYSVGGLISSSAMLCVLVALSQML